MRWHYLVQGQWRGPISARDLKTLADSGELQPTDWVHPEGGEKPVSASSVRGLFPVAGQPQASADLKQLGRFQIRQRLGQGAFGTVYRAHDPQLDREVAIKVPRPGVLDDPSRRARVEREARAAARLRHPHIVPVYEAGWVEQVYFIASAFINGTPLSDRVEQRSLDLKQAVRITRELADALSYAHAQGIVHRDVKPANVLLDERGSCLLTDFGLAHARGSETLTAEGAVLGTPAYMAPEQWEGKQGEPLPASDQYSLGIIFYELLCGARPFDGPMPSLMYQTLSVPPPALRQRNAQIPEVLEKACLRTLAKKPADRFADCGDLVRVMDDWLVGRVREVPVAPPISPVIVPPPPPAPIIIVQAPVVKAPLQPPQPRLVAGADQPYRYGNKSQRMMNIIRLTGLGVLLFLILLALVAYAFIKA